MRKAQQAVSNKASKDIEEFAQFQEVSRGYICAIVISAYLVIAYLVIYTTGTRQGAGCRGKAATCPTGSDWRRKRLPRISVAKRRVGSGLREIP